MTKFFQKLKKSLKKSFSGLTLLFVIIGGLIVLNPMPVQAQSGGYSCNFTNSTGNSNDLNLLPGYKDLFHFLKCGVVDGFLVPLSIPVAILAIVWGGYLFYFGSFTGKENGIKAVGAGVTGLVIILGYSVIINYTDSGAQGLLPQILGEGRLNPEPLTNFIRETLINNFLMALAGAAALITIIYGGYLYIASPFRKEDGLKTIQNGVIGLVVVLLAYPIVTLIDQTIINNGVENGQAGGEVSVGNNIDREPVLRVIYDIVGRFLLPISGAVTVIFIVLAAFKWITAQDSSGVESARKNLRNAVIGLVILLMSFAITQLVVYVVSNLGLGGQ